MGQSLLDRQAIRELVSQFRHHYSGRKASNWAMLGFCAKQVPAVCKIHIISMYNILLILQLLMEAERGDLIDDVLTYMKALGAEKDMHAKETADKNGEVIASTILTKYYIS